MQQTIRGIACAAILLVLFAPSIAAGTAPPPLPIVEQESVLAVLTHRAGYLSGLAHDHLITADVGAASLTFDAGRPSGAGFELETSVESLEVDRPAAREAWASRLQELGILDRPLPEISGKDRAKIRREMLGKSQLHAERHPDLRARVVRVSPKAARVGEQPFSHEVLLRLEVRGKSVERAVAARHEAIEGGHRIEAVGSFRFTEFGFEPYSAMLGAVRNRDEFHVYVNLVARAEE